MEIAYNDDENFEFKVYLSNINTNVEKKMTHNSFNQIPM